MCVCVRVERVCEWRVGEGERKCGDAAAAESQPLRQFSQRSSSTTPNPRLPLSLLSLQHATAPPSLEIILVQYPCEEMVREVMSKVPCHGGRCWRCCRRVPRFSRVQGGRRLLRVLEGKERTALLGVTAASIVLLLAAIRSELGAVAKLQTLNTNKREIDSSPLYLHSGWNNKEGLGGLNDYRRYQGARPLSATGATDPVGPSAPTRCRSRGRHRAPS